LAINSKVMKIPTSSNSNSIQWNQAEVERHRQELQRMKQQREY
jgi:hypothetical protein